MEFYSLSPRTARLERHQSEGYLLKTLTLSTTGSYPTIPSLVSPNLLLNNKQLMFKVIYPNNIIFRLKYLIEYLLVKNTHKKLGK